MSDSPRARDRGRVGGCTDYHLAADLEIRSQERPCGDPSSHFAAVAKRLWGLIHTRIWCQVSTVRALDLPSLLRS